MAQIDRAYVAIALLMLIVGELLGFYVGMKADNAWRAVHIVIVLVGFVTLAIYGMVFRMWPALKQGVAAQAQFWITIVGVAGIVAGSIQMTLNGGVVIIALAAGRLQDYPACGK